MRSDRGDENMKIGSPLLGVVLFVAATTANLRGLEPSIDDFSPKVGGPGDAILLTGVNFTSGKMTVRFYNGVVASIRTNSNTQITATVPTGAGTGALSIQKDSGSQWFTSSSFTAIGSGPYISDIANLSFTSTNLGAAGDQIQINGAHLSAATAVKFNGTNFGSGFSGASDGTWLNLYVPAGVSTGPVTVVAPNGTSNSPAPFTIIGPGPYVFDFIPAQGNSGTPVTIDGRFFAGGTMNVTNVQFNGVTASFHTTSDIMVSANAPANVMSGPITVMTTLGSYTTPTMFFVPPVITNIAPASGRSGTNVWVSGSSFAGATAVTFNGVPAVYSVLTNWSILATVPVGVSSGPIRVTAPAGTTMSASSYLVAPTISGFSPAFGPVGTPVTITGANFNVGTPVVRFNGVAAAAPTGVSFGQLTAVVPAGATSGLISVTTTDGSDTNASLFYLSANITSFTPTNSAPGTRVTITGQNFIGVSAVNFNGTPASFNFTNSTTVGATVPANVTTGPISITTPAGTAASSGWFYGPPLITGFAPTHGTPGTNVTITGTNFLSPITVSFNGIAAAVNSLAKGQLVVVVPSSAQSGPLTVATPAGTNTTGANFVVDQPADLYVWHVVGQSHPVTVGSNLVYTIQLGSRGPFAAPNARFTDLLPASVDLVSATIEQGTVATNGNPIIGTLGTFANGSQPTCVITVVPRVAGPITNTVSISSDAIDPSPSDNQDSLVTLVLSQPLLSIGLAADQVKVAWPGDLTNYVLQYRPSLDPSLFWSNVTAAPVLSNNQHVVTEPHNGSARYYRLSQ
jgi:uncharacterized repeat protein (TIGR01451 family)